MKLYPNKFPKKRCPTCLSMAWKVSNSQPVGCEPRMRLYRCKFNHTFYVVLTPYEMEIEDYLLKGGK